MLLKGEFKMATITFAKTGTATLGGVANKATGSGTTTADAAGIAIRMAFLLQRISEDAENVYKLMKDSEDLSIDSDVVDVFTALETAHGGDEKYKPLISLVRELADNNIIGSLTGSLSGTSAYDPPGP
jgi:hypothetical protein